jgi:hypothetical protein
MLTITLMMKKKTFAMQLITESTTAEKAGFVK